MMVKRMSRKYVVNHDDDDDDIVDQKDDHDGYVVDHQDDMMMRNDVHLLLEREAAIEPHHLNLGLKLQIASIKICLCSNHPSVFQ